MVDLMQFTLPDKIFEAFYDEVKSFIAENRKKSLKNDLYNLLSSQYRKDNVIYDCEHGPSLAEIEALFIKYEKSFQKLLKETAKLYPDIHDEEGNHVASQIPSWFLPNVETLQSMMNPKCNGTITNLLISLKEHRNGGKPRLYARKHWIKGLEKIYEEHTGKKATANKNYDTDFSKFVESFYKNCKHKMNTKEHVNNEIIYEELKKSNKIKS